jgi:glutathione S-transferase
MPGLPSSAWSLPAGLTKRRLGTTIEHMTEDVETTPGTLHLRRSLAAPPARVWSALTDPAELAGWFWPPSLRPRAVTDARPGGEFRVEGKPGAAYDLIVAGRYEAVQAPNRLVFTWHWENVEADDAEATQTLVTIELSPVDGATTLSVTHSGFPDEASRDDHIKGWSDCLDRLPDHLART